jgi:hypothetical protein
MIRSQSGQEDELKRDIEVEREVEEEQERPKSPPSLQKLIPNNQGLYEAMEFFLLGSPKRQVLQEGGLESLKKTADQERDSGNKIMARINYESAARIAIYEQNKDEVKEFLELADGVTGDDERFSKFHRTLLSDLDETMRVAQQYYSELEAAPVRAESIPRGDATREDTNRPDSVYRNASAP